MQARSCNYCCSGKAARFTNSLSVALVIQHAIRMRHIVIYGCTAFFPHYLINGAIFAKKNYLNIKCVF